MIDVNVSHNRYMKLKKELLAQQCVQKDIVCEEMEKQLSLLEEDMKFFKHKVESYCNLLFKPVKFSRLFPLRVSVLSVLFWFSFLITIGLAKFSDLNLEIWTMIGSIALFLTLLNFIMVRREGLCRF